MSASNQNIAPHVLSHIAKIGQLALLDKSTQKMLTEEGITAAKSLAASTHLSLIAKGMVSSIQREIARIAAIALNDSDVLDRLNQTKGIDVMDGSLAALVLIRMSERNDSDLPSSMACYKTAVHAMKLGNFDDPTYRKIVG